MQRQRLAERTTATDHSGRQRGLASGLFGHREPGVIEDDDWPTPPPRARPPCEPSRLMQVSSKLTVTEFSHSRSGIMVSFPTTSVMPSSPQLVSPIPEPHLQVPEGGPANSAFLHAVCLGVRQIKGNLVQDPAHGPVRQSRQFSFFHTKLNLPGHTFRDVSPSFPFSCRSYNILI